jgi:hypothetical protein
MFTIMGILTIVSISDGPGSGLITTGGHCRSRCPTVVCVDHCQAHIRYWRRSYPGNATNGVSFKQLRRVLS